MDQTTALVIGGALVALVIIVLAAGSRLKKVNFNLGKLFSGTVDTTVPSGAAVTKPDVEGDDNELRAKGAGSEVSRAKVKGNTNKIIAED